jgi:hypothetical protein
MARFLSTAQADSVFTNRKRRRGVDYNKTRKIRLGGLQISYRADSGEAFLLPRVNRESLLNRDRHIQYVLDVE